MFARGCRDRESVCLLLSFLVCFAFDRDGGFGGRSPTRLIRGREGVHVAYLFCSLLHVKLWVEKI